MLKKTVLHLHNLCMSYQQNGHEISVLKDITFSLRRGEVLALLGESGSGKSTIAKTITGLLPPSAHIHSGTLTVEDNSRIDLMERSVLWGKIRGAVIGMVFQDAQLALNPVLTIKEHFRETMLTHKVCCKGEVLSYAIDLLKLLGFEQPDKVMDSYPFQLSGGMCQRVCIALTLCLRPSILIADEPTSALDAVSQKEVITLLKNIRSELGVAVLLITHDIAVAKEVSDQVIILQKGDIVESGKTQDVFSHPKKKYAQELLTSRSKKTVVPTSQASSKNTIIDVIGLRKLYSKDRVVIQDLNLTLCEGEIIGILGCSGCGKSTLAKCIMGIEPISGGEIRYYGKNITNLTRRMKRELCKYIQVIFQDARASLNSGHTAIQLVQEPLNYLKIGSKKSRETKAEKLLEQVGIDSDAKFRRPPQLSTGQCQRIAIARALAVDPKVLVCDEVVSALDACVQKQIIDLLIRLHNEHGFAILMISHDVWVLQQFCHKIAVMHDGTFCEIDNTEMIMLASKSLYTQKLLKCAL